MELKSKLKVKGKIRLELKDEKTGETIKDITIDNLVPTVGRSALASILAGDNAKSNPGKITYCAVGTGTATPTITGTKLTTELDRTLVSASTKSIDNQAIIKVFFSTAQANGTLSELGMFGEDATSTADSGTMFQWILISPALVKTNTETLLITSTIPIEYV